MFAKELTAPARDTARSLVRGFFFGRYRPEHVVDVAYQAGGRGHVVSGLPIRPPGGQRAQTMCVPCQSHVSRIAKSVIRQTAMMCPPRDFGAMK